MALLVLLAACGEPVANREANSAATAEPRRGGTLSLGFTADLTGLNVYSSQASILTTDISHLQFLRLLDEQPDSTDHPATMAPRLAKSWEISPDGLAIIFHLRDDVFWSDGVPVTADDVRFTWQAQTHPDVSWNGSYFKESITDVEVIDPRTVRFKVVRPAAMHLLWINEGVILPKHAWSQLPFSEWRTHGDWFREHLVVAGPYRLVSWTPQQEFVLARNESYFEPGLPYIDRLVVRIVPDQSSLLNQTLAGSLDFMGGLSASDALKVEGSERVALVAFWSRGQGFVAWNSKKALFAEPEVRRALTLAIDRQAIVDITYGSRFGRVAFSPVVSHSWAANRDLKPLPYDPQQAREILARHGWADRDGDGVLDKDGKPLAFDLATNTGNQQRADAVTLIQAQLKKVGIEARPQLIAFNTLNERVNRGDFDAAMMRWTMPTDLDLFFSFHSKANGETGNIAGYSNEEMDRLLELAQAEPTLEGLSERVGAVQALAHRDQPLTYLYESQDLVATNRRVRDVQSNALERLWHLWEWWLAPAG